MSDSPTNTETKSAECLAFEYFLRTGRRVPVAREKKFNPYHDEIGRFTFAHRAVAPNPHPEGTHSASVQLGHGAAAGNPQGRAVRQHGSSGYRPRTPANDGPIPYLSPLHNQIRAEAARYQPAKGTREWSTGELLRWQTASSDVFAFKRQ